MSLRYDYGSSEDKHWVDLLNSSGDGFVDCDSEIELVGNRKGVGLNICESVFFGPNSVLFHTPVREARQSFSCHWGHRSTSGARRWSVEAQRMVRKTFRLQIVLYSVTKLMAPRRSIVVVLYGTAYSVQVSHPRRIFYYRTRG